MKSLYFLGMSPLLHMLQVASHLSLIVSVISFVTQNFRLWWSLKLVSWILTNLECVVGGTGRQILGSFFPRWLAGCLSPCVYWWSLLSPDVKHCPYHMLSSHLHICLFMGLVLSVDLFLSSCADSAWRCGSGLDTLWCLEWRTPGTSHTTRGGSLSLALSASPSLGLFPFRSSSLSFQWLPLSSIKSAPKILSILGCKWLIIRF